jgi:hypothetical protein
MKKFYLAFMIISIATLACSGGTPTVPPVPLVSVFDSGETAYGFFPSPPEATLESVLNHYKQLGEHADFVLFQHNVPWEEFINGVEGDGKTRTDIINQAVLARQNGMEYIFVVDALNGLDRSEFRGLPAGWGASFSNPGVRAAFTNYTLWVVRSFHPHYLGLASEINTYMDAHPEDAANFVSLYHELYGKIKAEASETQVFVTFQWDDLNNMFETAAEGRPKYQPNWDQIEVFEPDLDLWAISSYPCFVFPSGMDIPADYYSRLLRRTSKPVAVAEGGYTSRDIGLIQATPEDQDAYLHAIHDQLGSRLNFWVYLLLNDFNIDSYSKFFKAQGIDDKDISTLSMFQSLGLREWDGTPKPALEIWDGFRQGE